MIDGPVSRWMEVNGVRLHVADWGGDGSAVLLAHPTGFLGMVWKPVIDHLRALGFDGRVVTFDQRGHGLSSKPDEGYQWPVFMDDLEALMPALGLDDVIGVGHSGGATTIACVAARRPAWFRRLLLVDPILLDPVADRTPEGSENPMAARTRNRRLVWPSREDLYRSFRERSPYDTWTDAALRAYVDHGTFDRPDGEIELLCPGRIEAQVYENAAGFDPYACLEAVTVPVVFVRGATSQSYTPERAARAMSVTRGAELIEIPGTSHFVPMERPDLIAALIIGEPMRSRAIV